MEENLNTVQERFSVTNWNSIIRHHFDDWIEMADLPMFTADGILFLCDSNGYYINDFYPDSGWLNKHKKLRPMLEPETCWARELTGNNAIAACMESLKPEVVHKEDHHHALLHKFSTYAVPLLIGPDKQLIAIMGLVINSSNTTDIQSSLKITAASFQYRLLLHTETLKNNKLTSVYLEVSKENHKRDILFQVAKKLHSKIDVDSVLKEMLDNVKEVYPSSQIDLFLSQDNRSSTLPVKPLVFNNNLEDICTRAFLEGQLLVESRNENTEDSLNLHSIAAPLSGNQGVYGVLKFISLKRFDETDIKFISMLADTAGTAFENARLYEQSNFLIHELRLISEITKKLNQSLKIKEIFNFSTAELIKIFGAEFCCILELDINKEQLVVQSSNLPSLSNEFFSIDYGFAGIVYATKEPVIISDYWANPKVQSKLMEVTNSRSLIATPIPINSDVYGVILVAHRRPNFFTYENYKLLQVLSGHVGLAITNASLHDEVRRMVITDNLTGLYARHYLDEQVNLMQKKDFCGSLIVTDIDNFKKVNDTYGHQIGDKILIQVSSIIKSCIRESDIAARWGGEELAIYLPQATIDQTVRVAERIRNRVLAETNPQVTVSCGISEWNWEDEKINVEGLFYKADMALYEAKNSGKNQIKVGT